MHAHAAPRSRARVRDPRVPSTLQDELRELRSSFNQQDNGRSLKQIFEDLQGKVDDLDHNVRHPSRARPSPLSPPSPRSDFGAFASASA